MALKGDKEIGDKIIAGLASADDLRGVSGQADFNDQGRLGSGSLLIKAADEAATRRLPGAARAGEPAARDHPRPHRV